MTFMTMPKKLQKERRTDAAHQASSPTVKSVRSESSTHIERTTAEGSPRVIEAEEKCPVIRANHIVFSSGRTGRTRVVFY